MIMWRGHYESFALEVRAPNLGDLYELVRRGDRSVLQGPPVTARKFRTLTSKFRNRHHPPVVHVRRYYSVLIL